MGGEHGAAHPLAVGETGGDAGRLRMREGPCPPRVLRECWGVGVKELLMGPGFGHVYPADPPPPPPMHAHCIVEVAGLWDTTIG